MVFVETSVFTKQAQKLLSEEEYRHLQSDLANRPDVGTVIPGSGGLRKIRWGYRGQGKRGGVRVVYYMGGIGRTDIAVVDVSEECTR